MSLDFRPARGEECCHVGGVQQGGDVTPEVFESVEGDLRIQRLVSRLLDVGREDAVGDQLDGDAVVPQDDVGQLEQGAHHFGHVGIQESGGRLLNLRRVVEADGELHLGNLVSYKII